MGTPICGVFRLKFFTMSNLNHAVKPRSRLLPHAPPLSRASSLTRLLPHAPPPHPLTLRTRRPELRIRPTQCVLYPARLHSWFSDLTSDPVYGAALVPHTLSSGRRVRHAKQNRILLRTHLAYAARNDFSLYAHMSHTTHATHLCSPHYPHHLSITQRRPPCTQGECKGVSGSARHG